MKLREIFRFELAYGLRRVWTWLYVAVLIVFTFILVRENYRYEALSSDLVLNSPFVIAAVTVFACLVWLLVATAVAGDAAARDVQTGMYPLTYTAPVRKIEYLGGRFVAAFALNAAVLLAVPVGILLAVHLPGVEEEVIGPFRPAGYLTAYAFIAVPNAFVVTAIQFSFAAMNRLAVASYVGSVLLLVTAFVIAAKFMPLLDPVFMPLLDPIGVIAIVSDVSEGWTATQKNTRLVALDGSWLLSRLLWLGIALATLSFTHRRFRFSHPEESRWWRRRSRKNDAQNSVPQSTRPARGSLRHPERGSLPPTARASRPPTPPPRAHISRATRIAAPLVRLTFGFGARVHQTLAIGWRSFRPVATSRGGLLLLALVAWLAFLSAAEPLHGAGEPLLPRTEYVLQGLTTPDIPPAWAIIPLLIVFWAGEVVWREREAGLSEIVDAAPLPEWVHFLGKFVGLGFVLVACTALRIGAGMLVQLQAGYYDFEIGLYLWILGLQLVDYLLLAWLILVVQVVVNQKYIGHLVSVVAIGIIAYAYQSGIVHILLVYGSDPVSQYTEMIGSGPPLRQWLSFKLYWSGWAFLLAIAGTLFWVRGPEAGLWRRLHLARRRFTRRTAWLTAAAVAVILTVGSLIV